jgi:hypothetical protein
MPTVPEKDPSMKDLLAFAVMSLLAVLIAAEFGGWGCRPVTIGGAFKVSDCPPSPR